MEEDAVTTTTTEERKNQKQKHKGKHDKPKPWDEDPSIDHWKIEKFDPSWNPDGMLAVTKFKAVFPRYLEKYLQQVWPTIKSALKSCGLDCDLNLVKGRMKVFTTRKTKDPYIVVKARDLLRLLGRSVPAPQAIKILNDEMHSDIIKISTLIKNKEQFVKRRQRLVGPNGSTLKALEILTGCYILVQGGTVAAMGTSFKGLKQVRRVVEDCILNKMHPVYHIKILMIKKELEKDPTLKNESWDRFLPKFKKKNTKNKKEMTEEEKKEEEDRKKRKAEKDARRKKSYSPFPPPQPLSKEDIELETGEYFLTDKKKQKQKWQEKQEKQAEKTAENKRKREAAYIPPKEPAQEDRGKSEDNVNDVAAMAMSLKKKSKEFSKLKSAEKVNAEEYIAVSGDQPAKKKSKKK